MEYYKNTIKIILILLVGTMYAQQEPNYTMYRHTMNVINPAYAGTDGSTSLTAHIRSNWVGVEDGAETQSFFFQKPMGKRVGIGVTLVNDKVFIESLTSINIDFSYQVPLSENTNLYFGLKAGGGNYQIDRNQLDNYSIFPNDPALENLDTGFRPNAGLGGYLLNDKYYVSLSMPNILLSSRINNDNGRNTYATSKAHIYLSGGYNFRLSDNTEFLPSTLIRYVGGAPLSADITATFRFLEKFEVGASYRTDQAIAGLLSLKIADWATLGYAYDSSLRTELGNVSDGTHEVLLRFNFN
ncbi:MAG: type IX secretion system membrane protein PorP/SprF [Flavobacteriaceae bacterium]|nr:type IX secretion system membrane protein PorP/SprF [Flavobacteriaceae bacterium]